MELIEKFTSFDRTMLLLKMQIVDSLEFARNTCPPCATPEDLWNYLKPRLHFEDDPEGIEDFQSMQTLFLRKGYGDCDCFTITTVACLIVNNFDNIYVDLVGVSKKYPSHIYCDVMFQGQRCVLDFTNPRYNMERNKNPKGEIYKYRQRLPVRWKNWF